MSDEVVNPWNTAGQRTTTNYALGGRNEFGQRVPPKPLYNLHGIATPRAKTRVDADAITEMIDAFYKLHGRYPTRYYSTYPKGDLLGQVFDKVYLSFVYGAERDYVA